MGLLDMLAGAFGGDSSQQQALLNQLQGVANGTGPNPAAALLNQQTQNNNAMAAGQIAGAAGMSPALRARQIMETQRANQQQAAGQGATMQAEQSLGALGQMGTVENQQRQADTGLGGSIAGGLLGGASGAMGTGSSVGAGLGGAAAAFSAGGRVPSYRRGGAVPGRASVPGDSPQNDTEHALLSPGEVVLPRTVADDPERAAAFVRAIQRHHYSQGGSAGGSGPPSYGDVIAKQRDLEKRLVALERGKKGGPT